MENEIEQNLNEDNSIKSLNAFKPDFKGQKLKKNRKFIEWKNKMIEKYGNNSKLFYCIYDNIYFYVTNEDCKSKPYYKSKCSICNRPICYFCSRYIRNKFDHGKCCIKRRIYYILFDDGYSIINPVFESDAEQFGGLLLMFIIPIISFMYFVAYFSIVFFYKLSIKNTNQKEGYLCIYEGTFKSTNLFFTVIGFNVAFAFALSIPFTIIDTYFKILLFLINIPFKNYPLKFYLGILFTGLRGSL